ncbi:sulfatase [Rubritalea tangerina]|uniref:Sulfatase n=2 Tax=Rubritalea tangerina TaxID=430798 RepID=A0ABW4ZCJ1_9BACT
MMIRSLILTALCLCSSLQAAERPNILFILADDMGFGDLGCYGSSQIKTPALDALAANGVKFTDGYVSAPVCAPSRAGLLTGRYQQRFGFEHNLHSPHYLKPEKAGIPLDETTVAQRLKNLGYRTGLIGKWHVGSYLPEHHPNARGFDFFFGMLGGGHTYWPTLKKNSLLRNREKISEIRTPYLTDWFSREAEDFITQDSQNPWFLFLSYNTPHTPMQAKEEDLKAYSHISPKRRQIYCAMQKCMDDNIAQIISKLKATKQLENTLIVFCSDNGGSVTASSAINAPLNGMKGCFLEGGIRVPMIMHWPAGLKPGQTYSHPVITLDFTPTFVHLAGGKVEEEIVGSGKRAYKKTRDGVNLIPFLQGQKQGSPHQALFWRMAIRGSAVRSGQWKLIQTPHHPTMLFDLSNDLAEQHNLAPSMPEKVAELTNLYADWAESLKANPMWISDNFWSAYNKKLYDIDYDLTQPTGNTTKH